MTHRHHDHLGPAAEVRERSGALWSNVPVTQAYLVLSEALGHLDLLAGRGAVEEIEDGGLARYAAVGPGS